MAELLITRRDGEITAVILDGQVIERPDWNDDFKCQRSMANQLWNLILQLETSADPPPPEEFANLMRSDDRNMQVMLMAETLEQLGYGQGVMIYRAGE